MYEGRNALLFHPTTAVITWMSNPAQPSFVWQIYHYDLEPMSSYFAVMHASEMVHIQFNEATGHVQVINNKPSPSPDAVARVAVYNLDGSLAYDRTIQARPPRPTPPPISAPSISRRISRPSTSSSSSCATPPANCSRSNFYWRALPDHPDDLTALNQLPMVTLTANVEEARRKDRRPTPARRSRCTIPRRTSP